MPILENILSRPLPIALTTALGRRRWSSPRQLPSAQLLERLEQQVRVDRARAVADQGGHVVDLARLARLETSPRAGACPRARGGGAPRRSPAATGSGRAGLDAAVGEDEDVRAAGRPPRRPRRRCASSAPGHARGALGTGQVMSIVCGPEDGASRPAQLLELVVAQDGWLEHELVARARASPRAG